MINPTTGATQATPDSPKPEVHHARGWRAAAMWLLSVAMRVWCRTLRVQISPADLAAGRLHAEPCVLLLWHNRLFAVPWLLRNLRAQRPVVGLVSASRDGANLAALLDFIGIRAVRGSSSRFGREALVDAIEQLRAGRDVAVTPDGPRGPVYDMKPGALLAARRTRSPIILIGLEWPTAWRARSWDRFCIPRPFSRVVVRCEKVDPHALGHASEAVAFLRRRLLELNGENPEPTPAG